jgi:hypothetical protein
MGTSGSPLFFGERPYGLTFGGRSCIRPASSSCNDTPLPAPCRAMRVTAVAFRLQGFASALARLVRECARATAMARSSWAVVPLTADCASNSTPACSTVQYRTRVADHRRRRRARDSATIYASLAARTIKDNPTPTTATPTTRATRSPPGARRSAVIAAVTAAIARRSIIPTANRIAVRLAQLRPQ